LIFQQKYVIVYLLLKKQGGFIMFLKIVPLLSVLNMAGFICYFIKISDPKKRTPKNLNILLLFSLFSFIFGFIFVSIAIKPAFFL